MEEVLEASPDWTARTGLAQKEWPCPGKTKRARPQTINQTPIHSRLPSASPPRNDWFGQSQWSAGRVECPAADAKEGGWRTPLKKCAATERRTGSPVKERRQGKSGLRVARATACLYQPSCSGSPLVVCVCAEPLQARGSTGSGQVPASSSHSRLYFGGRFGGAFWSECSRTVTGRCKSSVLCKRLMVLAGDTSSTPAKVTKWAAGGEFSIPPPAPAPGATRCSAAVSGVISPNASLAALYLMAQAVRGARTCAGTPSAPRPTGPDCPLENSQVLGAGPSAAKFFGSSKSQ